MSDRTTMNGKPVFTVPAKTVINYKSHFDKKLLCDGITFTAGSACVYSCAYCYVEDMMRKQQDWQAKHGVTGDHFSHVVRRGNAIEIAKTQLLSKPEEFRRSKKVIYASPTVDVAGNMELARETVQICQQILELTDWDIRLLSKSTFLPQVCRMLGDYREAPKRVIYGVSIGTLDNKLAAAIEEGTPNVTKRLESLYWLQDNGYRTFGMICPSLPQTDYLYFSRCIADAIRPDKLEHVWAEVINVRGDSFLRTKRNLIAAGYGNEAINLEGVMDNKAAWETYARRTFDAHTQFIDLNKLRFLQYVTKDSRIWWEERKGAVLL